MFLNSLQTLTSLYLHVGRRAFKQPDHHCEVGDLVEAGDQDAEQKHDPGLACCEARHHRLNARPPLTAKTTIPPIYTIQQEVPELLGNGFQFKLCL